MRFSKIHLAVACALAPMVAASPALAGFVMLHRDQEPVMLRSGPVAGLWTGLPQHQFTGTTLAGVHDQLETAGIVTENRITIVLADTSEGLGLLVLFDRATTDPFMPSLVDVAMNAVAPSHADYWINDLNGDGIVVEDLGGQRTASGTFRWHSANRGDGFAWSNLADGDDLSLAFDRTVGLGAPSLSGVQFVNWTDSGWERLGEDAFDEDGLYTLDLTIGAVPAPGALGFLMLAAGCARRRRRRA